jgi:hypothetical protein
MSGLCGGTFVDQPVPMPSAPFTSTSGMMGTYVTGSTGVPSSSTYGSRSSSTAGMSSRANVESRVKMYRALAASFPPCSRVPNWPTGSSSAMLFDPTNVCAMLTMVECSDTSPWW